TPPCRPAAAMKGRWWVRTSVCPPRNGAPHGEGAPWPGADQASTGSILPGGSTFPCPTDSPGDHRREVPTLVRGAARGSWQCHGAGLPRWQQDGRGPGDVLLAALADAGEGELHQRPELGVHPCLGHLAGDPRRVAHVVEAAELAA